MIEEVKKIIAKKLKAEYERVENELFDRRMLIQTLEMDLDKLE